MIRRWSRLSRPYREELRRAGAGPFCEACGLPGVNGNPLKDYRHTQDCFVYEPSGSCTCGALGYVAHEFRCPVPVKGDVRAVSPTQRRRMELHPEFHLHAHGTSVPCGCDCAGCVAGLCSHAPPTCGWCDGEMRCTMPGGCEHWRPVREFLEMPAERVEAEETVPVAGRKPRRMWRRFRC